MGSDYYGSTKNNSFSTSGLGGCTQLVGNEQKRTVLSLICTVAPCEWLRIHVTTPFIFNTCFYAIAHIMLVNGLTAIAGILLLN